MGHTVHKNSVFKRAAIGDSGRSRVALVKVELLRCGVTGRMALGGRCYSPGLGRPHRGYLSVISITLLAEPWGPQWREDEVQTQILSRLRSLIIILIL